ncbi:hypothetical protein J0X19_20585 [Hymenobacter sp. BT186]|uniref:Uncharacterized protein n=1 Tax=Hymenobacter telluris TaxID=2816474 RepID=A0A939JEE9_9BACT|nr:hypothetical protein [Hymenobacter telluris]MBO0360370.1 hypothetical protein [Hymenobacter telluris]MBW3376397.1 hypothetical protein [Hymenobacter norwichensis]
MLRSGFTSATNSLELEIQKALREPDPVLANLQITRCHYLLAQALQGVLGDGAGANFHSWAVWGSRKAGVTIRQEDLDQARRDGSVVGSSIGGLVGLGSGWLLNWPHAWLPAAALIGVGCGLASGRLIISHSRRRSASLILAGNRTVLEDIGMQTVRFVRWLTAYPQGTTPALADFLEGLGRSTSSKQNLLEQAFTQYFRAHTTRTISEKQQATYLGNCFAVWHEHVRLEPYIQGAMPLIIRRCVTQRLLQFDIGPLRLAVAQDVPHTLLSTKPTGALSLESESAMQLLRTVSGTTVSSSTSFVGTAAHDWTKIKERMRYVFALFKAFHAEPQVCSAPYSSLQLDAIAAGQRPAGTL